MWISAVVMETFGVVMSRIVSDGKLEVDKCRFFLISRMQCFFSQQISYNSSKGNTATTPSPLWVALPVAWASLPGVQMEEHNQEDQQMCRLHAGLEMEATCHCCQEETFHLQRSQMSPTEDVNTVPLLKLCAFVANKSTLLQVLWFEGSFYCFLLFFTLEMKLLN